MTLSDDAITKAGVAVSPVTVSETTASIRLSGVVEPDAYRQVVVAPLVSGRVTRVAVTLGERVARNAPLVEIYSPDLAETQTRYLSMRAEFQAVEQEIARTDRLVEIGAASQQELERIHAEHVRHRTEVESARTRLQLLGMTPQQLDALSSTGQVAATTTVVSPIAGVVTVRTVNPGTTVDAATPLVTVVDLSDGLDCRRFVRARLLARVRRSAGDGDDDGISGPEASGQSRLYRSAGTSRDAHGQGPGRGAESGAAVTVGHVCRRPGGDAWRTDRVHPRATLGGSEPRRQDGRLPCGSGPARAFHRARGPPWRGIRRSDSCPVRRPAWGSRRYRRQLLASRGARATGTRGAPLIHAWRLFVNGENLSVGASINA